MAFAKSKNNGFTLIELMVVISIIGLLASVVLVSTVNVRKRARDIRRITDLRGIQTALELFYANNGRYPTYNREINNWDPEWDTMLGADLRPYISKLPQPPLDSDTYKFEQNNLPFCLGYPGNYLRVTKGYYLLTGLEFFDNPVAETDGGVWWGYEVFGGDTDRPATCP